LAAIEIEKLKKYYGKSHGVEDITLQVEDGEVFGFIGPNGAGKTTTIRVLLNLIYPTSGQARVLGLDAVAESRKIRAEVGYLPAEVGYYDDMRVRQLLEYSAGFYGMEPAETRRRISELAGAFELDVSRRTQDLSTGNRRKVGVVLAMLHRPKLLILDEPTGGLDPLMQARLFEVLGEENARGTTVFFSSHVLSEVQRFCNRVAIIKEGRIIKTEEVSALRAAQFQKVRITYASGGEGPLSLPGILHQESSGQRWDLIYNGDVNALVRALGERKLQSLALEEPTLEEIFLHYYETGREPA